MANTIKESNITDSAVTTSKIANNAITSDKIAPGAVVAADVGDGTITLAKLSATGTKDATTFLRGDNTFQTIATDLVNDTTPQLGGDLDLNSSDITGTGNINITGTVTATTINGTIGNVVEDTTPQLGGNLSSNGNDINFADNDKAIFGAGTDLQIYHDGSNSIIGDVATGNLLLTTNGTAVKIVKGVSGSETLASFNEDSSVELYYDNSKKFETTSTGIDVTGTLLTDKGYIAETTLTDGATIAWNMATQSVAKVTLGGNRTIAAPTNGSTGQFASLLVAQDGTGGRTLTWNAVYEFASDTAPTLTATASLGDLFVFRYNGSKWLEVGRNLALTLS
jgi:hypothetical protein